MTKLNNCYYGLSVMLTGFMTRKLWTETLSLLRQGNEAAQQKAWKRYA